MPARGERLDAAGVVVSANRLRPRARRPRTLGLLGILACLGVACRVPPAPTWAACALIQDPVVDECSGIVASRRHPDVYWVHNDSGDRARFFGIDRKGALLIEVAVGGANNVDWEDIATDDAGRLYIGDFGNNRSRRRDLVVYVVAEPDPRGPRRQIEVPLVRRVPFRYPDQSAFPDPDRPDFDCEAMFWDAGKIYLLTKHRSDLRTTLYRLDPERTDEQVVERLGDTEIGSMVTAADLSRDGRTLAVLSYHYIHLFERQGSGENFLGGKSHRTLIEGRQCEGLCIDDRRVLYTNEQREIYCVPIGTLWTLERYMPESPVVVAPRVALAPDGHPASWPDAAGAIRCGRRTAPRDAAMPASSGGGTAAAPVDSVTLRVGWCPEGLVVQLPLPPPPPPAAHCTPPETTGEPRAVFMLGTGSPARPCLEAHDMLWALVESGPDSFALTPWPPEDNQPRCTPPAGAPVARIAVSPASGGVSRRADVLLPIPGPPLAAGANIAFDVLLRIPGCGGADEVGWASTADMQPLGNPMLWGSVRLAGAAEGRSAR